MFAATYTDGIHWTHNNTADCRTVFKILSIFDFTYLADNVINNNSDSLSIIKDTARKIIPDCRILLFGSRARNDNAIDSDYDILVITRQTIDIRTKRTLKSLIRKELARFKIPADILIQSEDEINSKKEITGHILKQVLREGVAL